MYSLSLAFIVLGGGVIALPFLNPKDERARIALFGISIVLIWRYVFWRFLETLPPLALQFDSLYAWSFSMVEALACLGWTLGFLTLCRTKDRSGEAREHRAWLTALPRLPRVDVLITTYNEDEHVLARSIAGALGIDFPGVRVWVCDDGRRTWVRDLCQAKGALYLARPDNSHAKAGNLNYALRVVGEDQDPPEFIAIFDADFVAHHNFLWRTLPLFHSPNMGLVQTPQHFFNRDPIQSNLILGHIWPDEQRFFFDHVMPAKDAWGAAFCCGTSSVIRTRALQHCGGFPTDSVTEDFLLTLQLDRFGWQTAYLHERLSVGLAPEGLKEYMTQRTRWCLGLMQILCSRLGPFSRGRLSLSYRIGLIDAGLYWGISAVFKLLCLSAPIVYWFTGVTVGVATAEDVVSHFVPYYVAVMMTLYWITGGLIQPLLTDVTHTLTMPAALKGTLKALLKRRGHRFQVTTKGVRRESSRVHWPMMTLFGIFFGLTVAGLVYASFADFTPERQEFGSTAIVLFWSFYNIVLLLLAMAVCIDLPRYRREERFITSEAVQVMTDGDIMSAPLLDISASGAHIAAPAPATGGALIRLKFQDIGEISARIVRATGHAFAVDFVNADRYRDALLRKVYGGRYEQRPAQIRPSLIFKALVARALR